MPEMRTDVINNYLNQASTAFNVVDSLPVVGLLTSYLRIEIYKTAAVATSLLAGVGLAGQLIQPEDKKWRDLTNNTLDLTLHFISEVFRGYMELILAFTVIGSAALFLAQFISKNEFNPIFDYNTSILHYLSRDKKHIPLAPGARPI